MPIVTTKGDILNTEGLTAFAHGVNAAGTMDSGLSLAFKKKWPAMHTEVVRALTSREKKLGDVIVWTGQGVTVYSLVIQETASKPGKIATLTRAVTTLLSLAAEASIERIGLPRLGAGTAGLDFTRVKKLLAEVSDSSPVSLIVFDQFVRAKVPAP